MTDAVSRPKELIIVVHGFGSKKLWMFPLCYRLRRWKYPVVNWGYVSLFSKIKLHAERFRSFLENVPDDIERIHIVAHSLGSVIVRRALIGPRFPRVGRVVFLAPPSHGSPVATVAGKLFGLGRVIPPLRELSIAPNSYVNSLYDSTEYEIGIIAARFDLLVPVHRSHLDHESEHVVLNASHNSLLFSYRAAVLVRRFLECGTFEYVQPSAAID